MSPRGSLSDAQVLRGLRRLSVMPDWLRTAADGEGLGRALAASVPELATGGWALTGCVPKLRLKGGEVWTASYRIDLTDESGRPQSLRLAGECRRPTGGSGVRTSGELGGPAWRLEAPALGLVLHTEQHDDGLPALADLVDPAGARRLLQESLKPGVRVDSCVPEVMRYKPGSRCTVRYRVQYAPGSTGPSTIVAKTYHGDKGENAYQGMAALWRAGVSGSTVTLAEPLAYRPELKVLLQGPVEEQQTLKELVMDTVASGSSDLDGLRAEVAKAAHGLAAVHRSGVEHGAHVTWEDEWADLVEVAERVDAVAPEAAQAARPFLDALVPMAREHPADPFGPAHRSFRPAQVLLADGRIAFIDFDGLCTAEPAMDVALFRASLRDAGMRAANANTGPVSDDVRQSMLDEVCDEFLDRYLASNPISETRVALWESLYLLTSVLHCWTKVKPALLPARLASLHRHVASTAGLLSSTLAH